MLFLFLGKQWENTLILKTSWFSSKFCIVSAKVKHATKVSQRIISTWENSAKTRFWVVFSLSIPSYWYLFGSFKVGNTFILLPFTSINSIVPQDSSLSFAAFFVLTLRQAGKASHNSTIYLVELLKSLSKPYIKNYHSFWRIGAIITFWLKRRTFAHRFQITEFQRWFMSQELKFNRNVRKYNWRTTTLFVWLNWQQ